MQDKSPNTLVQASGVSRFIIGFGWGAKPDVIEAESLEAAETEAAKRTVAEGVSISDLEDFAWAAPYSDDLARDVGLLHIEDTSCSTRCKLVTHG